MTTTRTFGFSASADRLAHLGIERKLATVPGVISASANPAGLSVSVTYDETRTTPEILGRAIEDCGYHCSGEALPKHVCAAGATGAPDAEGHAGTGMDGHRHAGHTAGGGRDRSAHAGHAMPP
ncbi:MAG: heavy-metal-associated domain-containing protein, partial [Pseudomonadota bacterium]